MMELTLLARAALSGACSKALAFWAAAGPAAGPSTRADTSINVTSTFFISLLPKSIKDHKSAFSLSYVAAEREMGGNRWAGTDKQCPDQTRAIRRIRRREWRRKSQ